ncbi:MAG: phosphoribosyltransferase family protein [Ignavibacteriaceae bacterium]
MSLNENEIFAIFRETGALLEGHFLLTSGKHSNVYFQCAKVLQYPDYTKQICELIAEQFEAYDFETVVAPAMGGIIENMTLRRGFGLNENEKVLVCEDVITTGGSVYEVINIVKNHKAKVIGVGAIVDRSGGKVKFDSPLYTTLQINADTYTPEDCILCRENIPVIKPGSRKI